MATTAGQAVDLRDVLHMLQQVGQALLQGLQVLLAQVGLGHAAVVLQRADRGHDDHRVGAAGPAARHLMSRNFSAPRSAPKPASVTA